MDEHTAGPGVDVMVPADFTLDRELWRWVPPACTLRITRVAGISRPEPVRSVTPDGLGPRRPAAMVEALRCLGVTRFAVVPADAPDGDLVGAARAADRPDAEVVYLDRADVATYDLIAPLERLLGKPVLTANQVAVWAALRAAGRRAVGPGQALVQRGGGPDEREQALHKVRVRLPDEPGALARLTTAVAAADGNILALAVHGQDSRSVVDEMFVGSACGADELAEAVRAGLGAHDPGTVLVTPADPRELVDAPTRALDLAVRARMGGDAAALAHGLRDLVHADAVGHRPAAPDPSPHALALPAPHGGWLVATRSWAPFTVTEHARAAAFLRAAGPVSPRWEVVTLAGDELVAEPAAGDEIGAVEDLLCACLTALEPGAEQIAWTDHELRELLGTALLVRDPAGAVVALGAQPDDEPVLLVHPHYRGMRLGRWLRRRLAERSTLGA